MCSLSFRYFWDSDNSPRIRSNFWIFGFISTLNFASFVFRIYSRRSSIRTRKLLLIHGQIWTTHQGVFTARIFPLGPLSFPCRFQLSLLPPFLKLRTIASLSPIANFSFLAGNAERLEFFGIFQCFQKARFNFLNSLKRPVRLYLYVLELLCLIYFSAVILSLLTLSSWKPIF